MGLIGGILGAIGFASFAKQHKAGWAVVGIIVGGTTGTIIAHS